MSANVDQTQIGNNYYVWGLLNQGYRWDSHDAATGATSVGYFVDYPIGTTVDQTIGFDNSVKQAFDAWAAVANVTFVEQDTAADAEIVIHPTQQKNIAGYWGYSGTPNQAIDGYLDPETGVNGFPGAQIDVADAGHVNTYLAINAVDNNKVPLFDPTIGDASGEGLQAIIHELGHALGLKHPHDAGSTGSPNRFPGVDGIDADGNRIAIDQDGGDNNLNTNVYAVMSYNENFSVAAPAWAPTNFNGAMAAGPDSTPMAFDIAAVQQLYGANTGHNGGGDVYTLSDPGSPYAASWACIWDTGGTDAINYSGVFNAVIDLRPATLDDSPTGGGMPSYTWWVDPLSGITLIGRGFTIAGDVRDALPDQQGVTGVVIENASGGSGNDQITGNDADNVLSGNGGNDLIIGGGGNDTISGGTGTNVLEGDAGNDTFLVWREATNIVLGGDGSDTMSFAGDDAGVNVDLSLGSATFTLNNSLTVVGSVVFTQVENLIGTDFRDVLNGDNGANVLVGGGGADVLDGRGGADEMRGGAGDDTYYVDDPGDKVIEHATETVNGHFATGGNDTIISTVDYALPAFVENLILEEFPNAHVATGNALANHITGNEYDNILTGGAGNDILAGGQGSDTFVYGNGWGHDTILDFTVGTDHLDMTGVAGLFGLSQLKITDSAQGAVISYGADSIVLDHVLKSQLTAASFEFDNPAALAHTIDGTAWASTLVGTAGTDTVSYTSANYAIYVDLTREGGFAQALGGPNAITHMSSIENVIGSSDYINYLYGDQNDNILVGGNNFDWLEGGGGNNTLIGGGGPDLADYYIDNVPVTIDLTAGKAFHGGNVDTLSGIEQARGSLQDDTFIGDGNDNYYINMGGNDKVYGLGGNDWLDGGGGNTTMDGGTGNDKLVAGYGNDVMTGGADADTFVFPTTPFGHHEITDFNFAEGDRIDFTGNTLVRHYADVAVSDDGHGNALLTYATSFGAATVVLDHIAPSAVTHDMMMF